MFDKTGTGQTSLVIDVRDEVRVLTLVLKLFRTSPLSLSRAEETPVENFQAIEGKGVQGQIDQQLVTLGNGQNFVSDGSWSRKRMVELQEQAKTVISLSGDGQVITILARCPAERSKASKNGLKTVMLTGDTNEWPKLLLSKWELTPWLLMSFLKKKPAPSKNRKKVVR